MISHFTKYFFILGALALFLTMPADAQTATTTITTGGGDRLSPDAIAVRIIPNPNYYSVLRWFREQGFSGSPQAMVIDGYDAIRSGRTVYVSATNVGGYCAGQDYGQSCAASNNFISIECADVSEPGRFCKQYPSINNQIFISLGYCTKACITNSDCRAGNKCKFSEIHSNIYLISHNQDPEQETVDIFGRLLSHWQFNTNITEVGSCSISRKICVKDLDCGAGFRCGNEIDDEPGQLYRCILSTEKELNCTLDAECPVELYCSSLKAKIIRDMKRLTMTSELRELIDEYNTDIGHFPLLTTGSYLPGKTTSLWPSWGKELGLELGLSAMPADPINRFGYCSGFHPETCWNEDLRKFAGPTDYSPLDFFEPPQNSYAIMYEVKNNGQDYSLCSQMESGFSAFLNDGQCPITANISVGAKNKNNPPEFTDWDLTGQSGNEFHGYIRARDADADPIRWSDFSIATPQYPGSGGCWTATQWTIPELRNTADPNQKEIYAKVTGRANGKAIDNQYDQNCKFKLTISDGKATTTKIFEVVISNPKPVITADDKDYYLNTSDSKKLFYEAYVRDNSSLSYLALTETAGSITSEIQYPINLTTFSSFALQNGLTAKVTLDNIGGYKIQISGTIPNTPAIIQDTVLGYKILAEDTFDDDVSKNFNITLKNSAPVIQAYHCESQVRVRTLYPSCIIYFVDAEKNNVSFSANGAPTGMQAGLMDVYTLSGTRTAVSIFGIPTVDGDYQIDFSLSDDYGARSATSSQKIKVVTYCGDGRKQEPNTEGRGGLNDNGYESCDGTAGVGTCGIDFCDSSIAKPYGCTAKCAPSGGYCGDKFCDSVETRTNCQKDCP